jgi:hypothetical protein
MDSYEAADAGFGNAEFGKRRWAAGFEFLVERLNEWHLQQLFEAHLVRKFALH